MVSRLLSLFTFLLLALALYAGDPWKDKPYTDWTMEDIQKILSDSPWVKTDWVDAPWIRGEPHYIFTMPPSCPGRPEFGGPRTQPPGLNLTPMTQSTVGYQVTWNSARTVRAARVRLAVLCQQADPDEGEDALEREPEEYILSIQSPDMRPFEGLDEEALEANAYLLLKKSKAKLSPGKVRIGHGADRRSVYMLVFSFPKTTESGAPTIPPDEKEMEFICQAGKTTIKVRFQPPKMIARQGLDL